MNAKEISDSTLESVTPADNDLLIIYDTSEGTTGKATIADIAPKVAENIDIATLPAVTPAADDVLMIRDTSARTTGKATIADIAPKVAENIAIVPQSEGFVPLVENSSLENELNFTAPVSGLFNITLSKSSPAFSTYLRVNGKDVFHVANYNTVTNVLLAFVKQGDKITVYANGDCSEFKVQSAAIQKIKWEILA